LLDANQGKQNRLGQGGISGQEEFAMPIKHLRRASFALGFAFWIGQGADIAYSADQASIEAGKADFMTYCAACHGVSGRGEGSVAEFLTISAADLTKLAMGNKGIFPRDRAISVIDGREQVKAHGARDMPVWGDWFKFEADASKAGKGASEATVRKRIIALVDYIESIQER
jgi:mono/diheme cytochrome c family protein